MVFCENLLTNCVVLLYSMDSEKEKTANGGILMNFETMDKIGHRHIIQYFNLKVFLFYGCLLLL